MQQATNYCRRARTTGIVIQDRRLYNNSATGAKLDPINFLKSAVFCSNFIYSLEGFFTEEIDFADDQIKQMTIMIKHFQTKLMKPS